jgi:preprotein translocase subunit SecD
VKKNFFWRIALIAAATLLSVIFYLPSTSLNDALPEWLQKYGIVLGLDLQGGVHLVYEVDGDTAVDVTIERIASSLTNIFNEKEIKATAVKKDSEIIVTPADSEISEAVAKEFPGLELQSRSDEQLLYRINDSEISRIKEFSVDQALETIRNRVDQFGVAEPTIHRQAENEIVIQLPGVKDTRRAIDLVGKTAILEFKLLDDESPVAAQLPGSIFPDEEE